MSIGTCARAAVGIRFRNLPAQRIQRIRFLGPGALGSLRHSTAIRAKKVIGTDVKDPAGKSIGKVEDILLEKQSNNIMYAVVGFGGFLGMGEKYHPLPWRVLNYDDKQGAYIVNLTNEQLAAAPADWLDALTQGDGVVYRDRVYD